MLIIVKSLGLKTGLHRDERTHILCFKYKLTCILHLDVEQNQVRELNRVYWHYSTLTQIASPILICVFIVHPILDVVRKKILKFQWRTKFKIYLRVFATYLS